MDFNQHITIINQSINKEMQEGSRIRFISSEVYYVLQQKWRQMMIKILVKLRKKQLYDSLLIDDIITVVKNIQQQSFIEAVIHIQPFKPNFIRGTVKNNSLSKGNSLQKDNNDYQSKSRFKIYDQSGQGWLSTIFKFKHQIHSKVKDSIFLIQELQSKNSLLETTLALITEQQTLSKQFQAAYHPFRKIIDKVVFLLEHKYKNYISRQSNINIEKIQQMILFDINLLQEFIIKSSGPYLEIFKSKNKEQSTEFQIELIAFIKKYLEKHGKINAIIKKIMKFALKHSKNISKSLQTLPFYVDIDNFSIQNDFKINGEYFYAINSLIQFSQSQSAGNSLKKLQQLRDSIIKDIQLYYQNSLKQQKNQQNGQNVQIQAISNRSFKLSVQNQLQIIKFLICKAKIFLIDILTELKYLQIVLGQEQISYKYDDSSFMYAQLMVAIDILIFQNA